MDWFYDLFPPLASEHAARLDHVTWLIHLLMAALFLVWGGLFLFMLVRFRRGRQPRADYRGLRSHASNYGEGAVALAEAVLLVGFSIPLYSERVAHLPDEQEAVVVRVVGEQFAWNVHYPGADGVFGRSEPSLVDPETNPLGLDRDDPAGKDDITTINQLRLPVGKPALIRLSTKDVIHSLFLPEMRVKQDAIPGLTVPVWFTPTKTTAELRAEVGQDDRNYEIACAQLCGLGHYRMRGLVTIDTPQDFDAWLAAQAPSEEEEGDDFWQ